MDTKVIRNVRLLGAAAVDVVLDRAVIEAIVPAGSAPAQLPLLLDGLGQLLLPALVESHVHFDKTLWGIPWRPNTAGPTRNDRIANEQRLLPGIDVPIAERAGPLIEHCIARGSLHFAATWTRRRRSASGTSKPCSRSAKRIGT
jgi:cytosine deaminase